MKFSTGETEDVVVRTERILKRLLFAELRPGEDAALAQGMAGREKEWTRYLEKTALGPMLYHRAQAAGILDALPGEVRETAERSYKFTTAQNILRQEEFFRLADIFFAEGIPLAPLKGMWLISRLYSPIGVRPMSDTDLLVPRQRFHEAVRLMESSGYTNKLAFLRGDPPPYPGGIQFIKNGETPLAVELHWEIVNTFEIKSRVLPPSALSDMRNDLYRALVPTEKDGHRFYSLPDDFLLLSLVYHHFAHSFVDGTWFMDVVELLKIMGQGADAAGLAEKICSYGMGRMARMHFAACSATWLAPPLLEALKSELDKRDGVPVSVAGGESVFRQAASVSSSSAFFNLIMAALLVKKSYFEIVNARSLGRLEYLGLYIRNLLKIVGLAARGDDRHLRELPERE